jgi:CysZ protein
VTGADVRSATPPKPGLVAGFRFALRGVPFTLGRPRLLLLALIPIAINALLLALGFWVGLRFYDQLYAALFQWQRPDSALLAALWLAASWTVRVLLVLAIATVDFVAVVACSAIVAAPFNDALSERAESERRGHPLDQPFSMTRMLRLVAAAVRDQLVLLAIYLLGFMLLLLLHLIPLIGSLLASALTFLWSAWFLALEFCEPPLTRAGLDWRGRWRALRQRTRTAIGFGIGAWVLMLVPLTMPFLVVSGTLWACDDPALAAARPGPG